MSVRSTDDFDKSVGMRIRSQRLLANMSQQELAERLGVSFQQIQKYEKGANRVGASRVHQICKALEVSMSSIYEGHVEAVGMRSSALSAIHQFLATREGLALVQGFQKITAGNVRSHLIDLIEELGNVSSAQDRSIAIRSLASRETEKRRKSDTR
ncbi:helix-turn-helix transcriptional regulator [Tardiphaga sp.]|uniref:helix-turn-helix domain-containing protein n=1 Tax=Tardiphaga sp. TaxID=1926292 RepID=UPI002626F928|nr:helix-turn-helix transcriptional regulator [Tardiphaga sp.]